MFWTLVMWCLPLGFPVWDHWYCSGPLVMWCLPWVSQPGTTDTHVLESGGVYPGFPSLGPLIPMFWSLVVSTLGFPACWPLIPMFWSLVVSTLGFPVSQSGTTDTHVLDSGDVMSTLGFPAWDHWYPCSEVWWCLPWVSQHLTSMLHHLHTMDSSDSPLLRHLPTSLRPA